MTPGRREAIAKHVLLIEDSPSDATLITLLLNDIGGWQLAHATNLGEGIAHLQRRSFDVVILDLGLPDALGAEGVNDIRGQFNVPIVVLTGRSEREFGAEVITSGAQDYLSKDGVDADTLARSLRHAMQRHEHSSKLERMQRRLERYARAVAHDLRAPMATVRGFAELITIEERSAGRGDSRTTEYADRIIEQCRRLLDMVADLLEEPEDGDSSGPVDITVAARWVEEVFSEQLDGHDTVLTITRLPRVVGDRTTLRQVLLNLTANALSHAARPDDGRPLEIRWSSNRRDDGGWDVVIEDNGSDVADSLIANGQPLPVVLVRSDADGHGMGLRMVAAGMAEHDGQVWLSRGPTGGLRVTLAFPPGRTPD